MNPDPKPLLNTLPGDIPGLLRRGSALLYTAALMPAVVVAVIDEEFGDSPMLSLAIFGQNVLSDRCVDVPSCEVRSQVVLDLTDPTGRAHAAWWALDRDGFGIGLDHGDLIEDATQGADMIPEEIDALARLVLRLAGRES